MELIEVKIFSPHQIIRSFNFYLSGLQLATKVLPRLDFDVILATATESILSFQNMKERFVPLDTSPSPVLITKEISQDKSSSLTLSFRTFLTFDPGSLWLKTSRRCRDDRVGLEK